MKFIIGDSRLRTSDTDKSVYYLLRSKHPSEFRTLCQTGLELDDVVTATKCPYSRDVTEIVILIGVNDAAMRPFSRKSFRWINKKRSGFIQVYFIRKLLHLINKYIFSHLMYFYYSFFAEHYDLNFENRFIMNYENLLKNFPNLTEVRVINNIVHPGVYKKYIPGYEKRIEIINNVYRSMDKRNSNNQKIQYKIYSPLNEKHLLSDGIHFNEEGHHELLKVINDEKG